MKILSINKDATFNYHILETYLAGIALSGPEVKSAKYSRIDLKGSYISINNNEVILKGAFIAPYPPASAYQKNYDPKQDRVLLLTKKEINHLIGKSREKGITIIPLKVLNKDGLIKVEIAVAKGKKKYDKREDIKRRDFERRKQKITNTAMV